LQVFAWSNSLLDEPNQENGDQRNNHYDGSPPPEPSSFARRQYGAALTKTLGRHRHRRSPGRIDVDIRCREPGVLHPAKLLLAQDLPNFLRLPVRITLQQSEQIVEIGLAAVPGKLGSQLSTP
jgi:hypothetical protein